MSSCEGCPLTNLWVRHFPILAICMEKYISGAQCLTNTFLVDECLPLNVLVWFFVNEKTTSIRKKSHNHIPKNISNNVCTMWVSVRVSRSDSSGSSSASCLASISVSVKSRIWPKIKLYCRSGFRGGSGNWSNPRPLFDSKFHIHLNFWINMLNLEYRIYPKYSHPCS